MFSTITYAKLSELIEALDPANPSCRQQVQNLRAVVQLTQSLTFIEQQELNVRLYVLNHQARTQRD